MRKKDVLSIFVLSWAGLTLPVYILAALYLGSWDNLIASLDFENARSMKLEDIGVAILFIGPWIIIAIFLLRRLVSRGD